MTPFLSYPDTKTKHSIEIIDLRHQPDHITPKSIKLFHELVLILRMLDFFKYYSDEEK